MEDWIEQMNEWTCGDEELVNEWRSLIGDEPFVSLIDELDIEAEDIPELDLASLASTPSTMFPDGSEISDTFTSFSDVASQAELSEEELPSMIEGLYSKLVEVAQAGAQEMFAAASLESSIEAIDASLAALEEEIGMLAEKVKGVDFEIAELEAAVFTAESAVEEAIVAEEAAASEITATAAIEGTALKAEGDDWWTIIEGIISPGASGVQVSAVTAAKQKHRETQQKKKEAEESLKIKEDEVLEKNYFLACTQLKRDSKIKRQESLVQKRNRKQNELKYTENKVEANKVIHKTIMVKLWFIKYWLAKKNKALSRPLPLPTKPLSQPAVFRKRLLQPSTLLDLKRVKSGLHTIKEGDGYGTIRVIRANDESERKFKNKEFVERYGGWNRIAVVWEHVNDPSNKLNSLETVKIWASNNGVSNDGHSQCGMWGVIGDSAYEIAMESVGRYPKLYTFYENGLHTGGKQFQLDTYDSVFLCVRSAPYPAWEAACHGFLIQYTCL